MRLYRGPCHYGRENPDLPFEFRELFTRGIIATQRKLYRRITMELHGDEAADALIAGLESGKPFFAARFGVGEFEATVRGYDIAAPGGLIRKTLRMAFCKSGPFWWDNSIRAGLNNNAGFFPPTIEAIQKFSDLAVKDSKEIDILGAYDDMPRRFIKTVLPQATLIPIFDLEPFWNKNHWTRCLRGKKVLVVHSMPETIKAQFAKRSSLFKDPDMLPEFELTAYKSVNSAMGLKTDFPDWFAALDKMKSDIAKIDFDIALLGCGAYGMNLGAFVKRDLGKPALHIGGMLQLLFGIRGKRWEADPNYTSLYTDSWTRPLPQDTPTAIARVEDGCYW